MKQFLGNIITIICEIVILILSVILYLKDYQLEALITMIGALSTLVTSLFMRQKNKSNNKASNKINMKNSNNNVVFQGNQGKFNINSSKK